MTTVANLTEATSAAEDDLLYAYDVSAAASPDRKLKVSNLFKGRALTGTCTAPDQAAGDNSDKIANTKYADAAAAAAVADRAKIVAAPATAASPGTAGTIAYDASYFYVCVAANTWARTALATW